jgi:hypothetical protein
MDIPTAQDQELMNITFSHHDSSIKMHNTFLNVEQQAIFYIIKNNV